MQLTIANLIRMTTLLFLPLLMAGCHKQASIACPYSTDQIPRANAGCLITQGDDVMVITMRMTGKQSLPGGTAEIGESPRCTAYRETLEETGVKVRVHELLGELGNGFHVYRCEPINSDIDLNVVDWKEVSDVSWRSWLSLDDDNWRYPEYFAQTRQMIRQNITGLSKQLEE